MSEDFEDISIDVVAPVADTAPFGGGADGAVMPTDGGSVSEQPDTDQRVFDNNTRIGSAEDNIRQDIAAENGIALSNGGDEGRAPVTERGKEEAENKKQEARAALMEHLERAENEAKRRDDWLNKQDHDFGGMKMSGHDLDKLIQLYHNNPQMQDKLKERMIKSGKSDAQADKAVKDFNEYMKILKKESEGKELTEEERRRKEELQKDKDVQQCAAEFTNMANRTGLNYKAAARGDVQAANVASSHAEIDETQVNVNSQDRNLSTQRSNQGNDFSLAADTSFGKQHFTGARDMKCDFSVCAANVVVAQKDSAADMPVNQVAGVTAMTDKKSTLSGASFG